VEACPGCSGRRTSVRLELLLLAAMAHRAPAWLPADEVKGGEMGRCPMRKKGVAALLTGEEGRPRGERRRLQISASGGHGALATDEATTASPPMRAWVRIVVTKALEGRRQAGGRRSVRCEELDHGVPAKVAVWLGTGDYRRTAEAA
jgi:hypothetical protein